MDRVEVVAGLDRDLLDRVVGRLRELEPSTVAVFVSGSYAKETADEASDLDVQVATPSEPAIRYFTWFEERPELMPLSVSARMKSIDSWLAKRGESQEWALGFPVLHVARYVWATDEARTALGDPPENARPLRRRFRCRSRPSTIARTCRCVSV